LGQTKILANYQGPKSCRLLNYLNLGPYECPEACLGQGDCTRSCPYGALTLNQENDKFPIFNEKICRGCGKCLSSCPKNLITLLPKNYRIHCACSGKAKMKKMDLLCQKGCLSCSLCRKSCPAGAIGRPLNQAPPPINHHLCLTLGVNCQMPCLKACPKGLILPNTNVS
jgi:electron transport complex protein RnfB